MMTLRRTNYTRVSRAFQRIPEDRKKRKRTEALIGVAIIVGVVFAKEKWPDLSSSVAIAFAAFGGFMASKEYTAHPLKLFIALLRDVFTAIGGNGRRANDEEGHH